MPKENDQYINDPPAKLAITIKVKALNLIHDWALSRHHELIRRQALECTTLCVRGSDLTSVLNERLKRIQTGPSQLWETQFGTWSC